MKDTKVRKLKQNTLVKFDYETLPKQYHLHYLKLFPKNEVFVFMGEIKQMKGHCMVCNYKTGKIICGYHTDNFIKLKKNEC